MTSRATVGTFLNSIPPVWHCSITAIKSQRWFFQHENLPTETRNTHKAMRYQRLKANCSSKFLAFLKYILSTLAAVVAIVIVVPLAIMFGRKRGPPPRSSVLIPLYIYPAPGTWDPLFAA
jgi:hypothetical protein